MRIHPFLVLALVHAGVMAGCRPSADERDVPPVSRGPSGADTAAGAPLADEAPVAGTMPARDSVDANAIDWSIPLVLERLGSATLPPRVVGTVPATYMRVPGTRIAIPGAELEAYVYGDASAAALDVDRFYSIMRMPAGAPLMWQKSPALIVNNNLVIVTIADDSSVKAHVQRIFGLSRRRGADTGCRRLPPPAACAGGARSASLYGA